MAPPYVPEEPHDDHTERARRHRLEDRLWRVEIAVDRLVGAMTRVERRVDSLEPEVREARRHDEIQGAVAAALRQTRREGWGRRERTIAAVVAVAAILAPVLTAIELLTR